MWIWIVLAFIAGGFVGSGVMAAMNAASNADKEGRV